MFAYCGNNPVNYSDPTGEVASWIVSGIIGMVTNVSCALISGAQGKELIMAAAMGFLSGANKFIGIGYSVISSCVTAVEYAEKTGSVAFGLVAGLASLCVSFFTGENIRNLKWVNKEAMDTAAQLFFDAFFGYGANVFVVSMFDEASNYYNPFDEANRELGNAGTANRLNGNYSGLVSQMQYICVD